MQNTLLITLKNPKTDLANKMEILDYLSWIRDEFGLTSSSPTFKYMTSYLLSDISGLWSDAEVKYRCRLMKDLPLYATHDGDILQTILPYLLMPYSKSKDCVTQILELFGVKRIESDVLYMQLKYIVDMTISAHPLTTVLKTNYDVGIAGLKSLIERYGFLELLITDTSNDSSRGFKNYRPRTPEIVIPLSFRGGVMRSLLDLWLHECLKEFLLVTENDPDQLFKLKNVNSFGLTEKKIESHKSKAGSKVKATATVSELKAHEDPDLYSPKGWNVATVTDSTPLLKKTLETIESSGIFDARGSPRDLTDTEKSTGTSVPFSKEDETQPSSPWSTFLKKPPAGRGVIQILMTPTLYDFVTAINFHVISNERSLVKNELAKKIWQAEEELKKREAEAEEKQKRKHDADLLEEKRLLQAEKMRKNEAIVKKREAIINKFETDKAVDYTNDVKQPMTQQQQKPKSRNPRSRQFPLSTEDSADCLNSKDQLDTILHSMSNGTKFRAGRPRTPISMYTSKRKNFQKMMPMDFVDILPFDNATSLWVDPAGPNVTIGRQTRIFDLAGDSEVDQDITRQFEGARQPLDGPAPTFVTNRKFFFSEFSAPGRTSSKRCN